MPCTSILSLSDKKGSQNFWSQIEVTLSIYTYSSGPDHSTSLCYFSMQIVLKGTELQKSRKTELFLSKRVIKLVALSIYTYSSVPVNSNCLGNLYNYNLL